MGGFLISRGKIHKPPQEVVLMTEEQKNVVIKRRNSGFGYASIAKEVGLTKDAVVAFCRRNGAGAGRGDEDEGVLLCAVPEEMVEGASGDAEQKSGLHPYLRRVRQGVHGLR